MDLNCDMGESFGPFLLGHDELLMPHVTSVNIACGFHAGDPSVMRRTVALAKAYDVRVGAHPGYPDLAGFGRRLMGLSPDEVYDAVVYQVGALLGVARTQQVPVTHVKAHGALYNAAVVDDRLAAAIARAVKDVDPALCLVGMCGSKIITAGEEEGLCVAHEVFADRAYQANRNLVPRSERGAVHMQIERVVEQALEMVTLGYVTAITGERVPIIADTLCVHGDGRQAVDFVRAIRTALSKESIGVQPLGAC